MTNARIARFLGALAVIGTAVWLTADRVLHGPLYVVNGWAGER